MPEPTEPPAYCTQKPTPGSHLSDNCDDCGHLLAVHIGTNHCPVCEMVDLNRQLAAIVEGGPQQAMMRAALHAMGTPPERFRR